MEERLIHGGFKPFCLGMLILFYAHSITAKEIVSDSSYTVTFIINEYPEDTPYDASIYLVGEFDSWYPDVKSNKLEKQADGSYQLTRSFVERNFQYKFTRGSWKAVEDRGHGRSRQNRIYDREKDGDTVYITIKSWEDFASRRFNAYVYILLLALLQCLLMLFAILSIRNRNKRATAFLSFLLLLMAFALIGRAASYHSEIFNIHPKMLLLPDIILFTYAPSFLIFIHHLLKITLKYRKYWYLHYLPAVIHILLYIPYLMMDNQAFIYAIIDMDLFPVFAASGIIALVYNSAYWFLALKVIRKGAKEEKQNEGYQQTINFLKVVLKIKIGYLVLWTFSVIIYVIGELFQIQTAEISDTSLDVLWILFSALVFYIGYHVIKQPEILLQKEAEAKYKDSVLAEGEFEKVKSKLEQLMMEKIYLDPDLTLLDLANKIPTSIHTLSRVINEGYDHTFSFYINEYRIKEFIMRMEGGEKTDSFLGLAFSVGFNSKATFNRTFKKYTGNSPSVYFKNAGLDE